MEQDKNWERVGHECDSKPRLWSDSMGVLEHKLSHGGERAGPSHSYC